MYNRIKDAMMFLPQVTENKRIGPGHNQPASNSGNPGLCKQNFFFTALNQLPGRHPTRACVKGPLIVTADVDH